MKLSVCMVGLLLIGNVSVLKSAEPSLPLEKEDTEKSREKKIVSSILKHRSHIRVESKEIKGVTMPNWMRKIAKEAPSDVVFGWVSLKLYPSMRCLTGKMECAK